MRDVWGGCSPRAITGPSRNAGAYPSSSRQATRARSARCSMVRLSVSQTSAPNAPAQQSAATRAVSQSRFGQLLPAAPRPAGQRREIGRFWRPSERSREEPHDRFRSHYRRVPMPSVRAAHAQLPLRHSSSRHLQAEARVPVVASARAPAARTLGSVERRATRIVRRGPIDARGVQPRMRMPSGKTRNVCNVVQRTARKSPCRETLVVRDDPQESDRPLAPRPVSVG